MIKIMLADDQQLVREALAALLGLEHDIEVVAQVGGGDEVLPAINRYHPDVVLLDIEMPGSELSSGIDVAAAIRDAKLVTLTGEPVRSLIVTTFGRPGYLRRALAAGASGFMVRIRAHPSWRRAFGVFMRVCMWWIRRWRQSLWRMGSLR